MPSDPDTVRTLTQRFFSWVQRPRTWPLLIGGAAIALCIYLVMVVSPPSNFPTGERIEIPQGASVIESTELLARADVVRSPLALQIVLVSVAGEGGVKAGTYQFPEPLGLFAVARAVTEGTYGTPLIRVTIPEGLHTQQIDALVSAALPAVEPGAFLRAAAGKEGYLFPETYYVPETYTAAEMVALMEETAAAVLDSLAHDLRTSPRTQDEIVTMASLIEREANTEESMRLVSGILWKRLDEGMRLQVDAVFSYLLDKESSELTLDDLEIDSPYNTYRYAGLPPTPISNPGEQALRAALRPTDSPYYYYLTAPDGTFYYAATFEEHRENKERYLR